MVELNIKKREIHWRWEIYHFGFNFSENIVDYRKRLMVTFSFKIKKNGGLRLVKKVYCFLELFNVGNPCRPFRGQPNMKGRRLD